MSKAPPFETSRGPARASLLRFGSLLAICGASSALAAPPAAPTSTRSSTSTSTTTSSAAGSTSTSTATSTSSSSATPTAANSATPAPSDSGQDEPNAAQSEPPTLESRIPPVSGQAFTKAKKFEISVGMGFSLNDAFIEKFMPEISLGYHLDENFYLGLRAGYAFDTNAGHVNACDSTGANCGAPTSDQLKQLPGNMTALVAVQFAWTPIYGKMNFFGEKVLHFDTSLLLDGGALILGTQPDPTASTVAPEFSPGIGWRIFFTPGFALASEFRDIVYFSAGTQNQLMFHLGLTFLL